MRTLTKLACGVGLFCLTLPALGQDAATKPAATRPAMNLPTTPLNPTAEGDFVIGPNYTDAPELTEKEGVPKGVVKTFVMESKDSKFYPGIKKGEPTTAPYSRKVGVYIPSQYVPGTPAPFIICQDANNQKTMPTILDSMINDKRVPAMVAIFIASGGGDGKGSERGLEYDTVSGKYAEFIETEVLPKISADYNITFTKDPDARATLGGSSGGACAFTMAWFHPELYHRVLTYSGTYVNQQSPENPDSPHGAWEYHEHWISATDRKPIRIWLEVSENDNGATSPESGYHNWVLANVRMAEVLKAKGYHYQFVYALAAKHTDKRVTAQTLPAALEWLWKDYQPK